MALRIIRWTLTACAAALWAATLASALSDTHIKIYLTVAMATFLVSASATCTWIIRADHLAVALARNRIREARLMEALREEAAARPASRYSMPGRLNHLV